MSQAYRCERCEEFVEGTPAGELKDSRAGDWDEHESFDLCSDCLGYYIAELENESLRGFGECGGGGA